MVFVYEHVLVANGKDISALLWLISIFQQEPGLESQ